MIEFRMAVVDECGCLVCWCSDFSDDEINTILAEHPEWKKKPEVCYW